MTLFGGLWLSHPLTAAIDASPCQPWFEPHLCPHSPFVLLPPQWFERLMDIAGLIAGFTNVYVTKVQQPA